MQNGGLTMKAKELKDILATINDDEELALHTFGKGEVLLVENANNHKTLALVNVNTNELLL